MNCGIYIIVNSVTNKFYIGSAVNISARWRQHLSRLKACCHDNIKLQCAYNKHGKDAFNFYILELVYDKSQLLIREQFWLDKTKAVDCGYNIQSTAGSNLGRIFSKEHKDKISLKLKNRVFSDETRRKISIAKTGKKRIISETHKANLSKAMIGNKNRIKNAEAWLENGIVVKVK